MAIYTRHPTDAPPQAPTRESSRRLLLRAHAITVVAVMFAAPGLVHAFQAPVAAAIGVLVTLGSIAWWVPRIVRRRFEAPFPWRRLPWAALGYVFIALLSVAWSAWRDATLMTGAMLLLTTMNGVFLASSLSWRELIGVLASGLKWVIGISVVFELVVSIIIRHPVFPVGFVPPTGDINPQWYWSRDNLLDGFLAEGRIQGIVGNANLLGMICVIALLIFAVRLASVPSRRGWLVAWIVLTAYLLVRSGSATAMVALCAAVGVVITALIMRTARTPRARTVRYVVFFGLGAVGVAIAVLARDALFGAFGKTSDLTGRGSIWATVLDKAAERPLSGWGFSTPWVPTQPEFAEWIIDHEQTVMQAHNAWIDVYFQLGLLGVAIVAVVCAALLWRAWFFAIDRPRWDIVADRPFTALSTLPLMLTTALLVQSLTETNPVMLWGWMLIIALSFKMKISPVAGRGVEELSTERIEQVSATR